MLRQVLHEVSEAYTVAEFGISDVARHFLTLSLSKVWPGFYPICASMRAVTGSSARSIRSTMVKWLRSGNSM